MPVTTESAQVFRGGGRRWFSKGAAINAEANAAWKLVSAAKDRCDCESRRAPSGHMVGFNDDSDWYECEYHQHESPVRGRYIRYVRHLIKKTIP